MKKPTTLASLTRELGLLRARVSDLESAGDDRDDRDDRYVLDDAAAARKREADREAEVATWRDAVFKTRQALGARDGEALEDAAARVAASAMVRCSVCSQTTHRPMTTETLKEWIEMISHGDHEECVSMVLCEIDRRAAASNERVLG